MKFFILSFLSIYFSLFAQSAGVNYIVNEKVRVADYNGSDKPPEFVLSRGASLQRVPGLDKGKNWLAFRVTHGNHPEVVNGQIYYQYSSQFNRNVSAGAMDASESVSSPVYQVKNTFPFIGNGWSSTEVHGVKFVVKGTSSKDSSKYVLEVVEAPAGISVKSGYQYEAYKSFVDNPDNFYFSPASVAHNAVNLNTDINKATKERKTCSITIETPSSSYGPEEEADWEVVGSEETDDSSGVTMKKFDCDKYIPKHLMNRCGESVMKALSGKVIALDPGHIGGKGVGDWRGYKPNGEVILGDREGYREGREAMIIALMIKKTLEECFKGSGVPGPKVKLTRENTAGEMPVYDAYGRDTGETIPYEDYTKNAKYDLERRAHAVKAMAPDIFLSIHTNGTDDKFLKAGTRNYGRIEIPRARSDVKAYDTDYLGHPISRNKNAGRDQSYHRSVNMFSHMKSAFEQVLGDTRHDVGYELQSSGWRMNSAPVTKDEPIFRNVIDTGIPMALLEPYFHNDPTVWENMIGKDEHYTRNVVSYAGESYKSNRISEEYAKSVVQGISSYFGANHGGCH